MQALNNILQYKLIDFETYQVTVFQLFIFIAILVIAKIILSIFKMFLNRQKKQLKIDHGRSHSIYKIAMYVCWTFAIIIGLNSIGIEITILLAGSAALLVGVGLGLQQTFNDLVCGIIILFEGTIQVRDIVEVSDIVGRVTHIGIRTSKIVTRDNIIMIVPNSKFVTDMVINWSHIEEQTRFKVTVGVAYGSDVQLVKKLLTESVGETDKVSKTKKPIVRFIDFGESSLDFEIHFWTTENFGVEDIKSDLRFTIDQKFRDNKVQIPFPQRDLHLISSKINFNEKA